MKHNQLKILILLLTIPILFCTNKNEIDKSFTLLDHDFNSDYSFFAKISEYKDVDSTYSKVEIFEVLQEDRRELIELDSLMKPYFDNKTTPDDELLYRYENIDLNYEDYVILFCEIVSSKNDEVVYKSKNLIWLEEKNRTIFLSHIDHEIMF